MSHTHYVHAYIIIRVYKYFHCFNSNVNKIKFFLPNPLETLQFCTDLAFCLFMNCLSLFSAPRESLPDAKGTLIHNRECRK